MDYLQIKPTKTVNGAISYIFECDFMLCSGSSKNLYQLYFRQGGEKTVEINIGYKDGKVTFTHHDSSVGKWSSVSVANTKQWFNLRLEYYTVTENGGVSTRLKIFINDTLSYVTDISLSSEIGGSLDCVGISAIMSADAVIYLDNIRLAESTAGYDGVPVTEGFKKGTAE